MAEIRSGIWGTCPWTISDDGVLTIGAGTGDDTHGYSPWNWFGDDIIEGITSVRTTGTVVLPANSSSLFLGFSNAENIDMSGFDTRNVTNMNYMFDGCYSLTSLDLSSLDTRNVTSMRNMFQDCSSLSSLDMSSFNTENVTGMSAMFYNCSSLTSLDLSNFNTGKVTDMSIMFSGCKALTSLDLSKFDTRNVADMGYMFDDCSSLSSLDLSSFDTGNVTNMEGMFSGCEALTSLDISKFNTEKATNMGWMFSDCSKLSSLDMSNFDTGNVTNMSGMFSHCLGLTSLDLSNFNTGKVANIGGMFAGCAGLTSLDLSKFDTRNVADMGYMFSGCSGLPSLDLSNFDTKNVWDMAQMFDGCASLTSLDLSGFDTEEVENMGGMFHGCSNLTSLDLSGFDTKNVWNMTDMFRDCGRLTSFDLSNFDTRNVTDMDGIFFGCPSLASLELSGFNAGYTTKMHDTLQKEDTNHMSKMSVREIQKKRGAEFKENSVYYRGDEELNAKLNGEGKEKAMLEFESGVLFRQMQKIRPIHETAGEEYRQRSLQLATTYNRILQEQTGYGLSAELLMHIAKEKYADAKEEISLINSHINEKLFISAFKNSHTFYPNFPEEVMEKSDAELYMNAVIYYSLGTYGLQAHGVYGAMREAGLIEEETKRKPLLQIFQNKPKYIAMTEENYSHDDFLKHMSNVLGGNTLNEADRRDLLAYAYAITKVSKNPKEDLAKLLPDNVFSSKENEALACAWLHDHGYDDIVFDEHLCREGKTILRVISDISLKNGAANGVPAGIRGKDKPIMRPENIGSTKSFDVRLTKEDKAFVKKLMSKTPSLKRDMAQDKDLWKKVMRNIDARKGPKNVVAAFNALAKNDFGLAETKNAALEKIINSLSKAETKDEMKSALENLDDKIAGGSSGLIMRRAVEITKKAARSELSDDVREYVNKRLTDIIARAAGHVPPLVSETVKNIAEKNDFQDRIARTKNGVILIERETENLTEDQRKILINGIKEGLKDAHDYLFPTAAKVYIDPALDKIKAPQRADAEASNGSPYSRGSVIDGDKNKNLIMFGVHWNTYKGESSDIDIHAIAIKDLKALAKGDMKDVSDVGFFQPKTSFAVHSGDYTESDPNGDGSGAEEFVVVDKEALKKAGYRYLGVHVHDYNGVFRGNDTIKMVMMQREGSLSNFNVGKEAKSTYHPVFNGEIYEPSMASVSIGLTGTKKSEFPLIYDAEKDNFIWLDMEARGLAVSDGTKEWGKDGEDGKNHINNPSFDGYGLDTSTSQSLALCALQVMNNPSPTIGQMARDYVECYPHGKTLVSSIEDADLAFVKDNLETAPESTVVIPAADKGRVWDVLCSGEEARKEEERQEAIEDTLLYPADEYYPEELHPELYPEFQEETKTKDADTEEER